LVKFEISKITPPTHAERRRIILTKRRQPIKNTAADKTGS
jgi:hypothetical protein